MALERSAAATIEKRQPNTAAGQGCPNAGRAAAGLSPKPQRDGTSVYARKVAGSNPAVPMIRVALWTAWVAYCHVNVVIACGGMV